MKETRDILTLFEALSNHEIFTPPKVARDILECLPPELWQDPDATLLDPCAKSGVFLREALFRFDQGLREKGKHRAKDGKVYDLSNFHERTTHILKNMLYGIAISELTGYVSRRTLYGVMEANTDKQLAALECFQKSSNFEDWTEQEKWNFVGRNKFNEYYDHTMFNTPEREGYEAEGNVFYPSAEVAKIVLEDGNYEVEDTYFPFIEERTQHPWVLNIRKGTMKFDVIVGNPPYQISDGGHGRSAKPVYQDFVNQAIALEPKHLVMITPSRWFVGGRGLGEFRAQMLKDRRIKEIVDYPTTADAFPGVDISGGVSFFHWQKNYNGMCTFKSVRGTETDSSQRFLDEFPVLVRSNQALPIVKKVRAFKTPIKFLSDTILPSKPFGMRTNYEPRKAGVPCWFVQKVGLSFCNPSDVVDSAGVRNKWKLLIPKAPIAGQTDFSKPVKFYYSGNVRIAKPGEVCTESWQVACAFDTLKEVENFKSYLFTKCARFLLLQAVVSQDVTRQNFCFVPDMEDYSKPYSDEQLRTLWGITPDEWEFIESRIQATE